MPDVRISVVIERPQRDVWEYVTDLRNDSQWFRGIEAVRVLSDVETGAGATYEQTTRLFGHRFIASLQVIEYDPPHRMMLKSIKSAIPFTATYLLQREGNRCATRFTLVANVAGTGVYRWLGPLFLPLLRRAVRRRFAVLKSILEQ